MSPASPRGMSQPLLGAEAAAESGSGGWLDDRRSPGRPSVVVDIGEVATGAAADDPAGFEPAGVEPAAATSRKNCLAVSFPTLVIAAVLCVVFVLGKDYIKELLSYVESMDALRSSTIFAVLFTSVSFPFCWGYVLLNLAVGYLYGVARGTALTSLCAGFGVAVAHITIRRYIRNCVMRLFETNDQFGALMVVFSGQHAYRLVMLTRLTPLPFGLQNSLFAVSKINTARYLAASFVGLLPTQVLFTYMGSTLRSMEEVFSDGNTIMGWIIFSVQIMFSVGLTVFIVRKAKAELNNAVTEQNRALHEADSRSSSERRSAARAAADFRPPHPPHVAARQERPGGGGMDRHGALLNKDSNLPHVHDFRSYA